MALFPFNMRISLHLWVENTGLGDVMKFRFLLAALLAAPFTAHAAPVSVSNHSFESGQPGERVGDGWTQDYAETVEAQGDITPLDGERMLQFISTSPSEGGGGGLGGSEIFQSIDLSAYQDEINTGEAVLSLSAFFNRIAGDAQTDTLFSIEFKSSQTTSFASAQLFSDDDPATWEELTLDFLLPVGLSNIVIALVAQENIFNTSSNEFDGHFADLVSVSLNIPVSDVPIPAALPLFLAGLAALGGVGAKRKRKKR